MESAMEMAMESMEIVPGAIPRPGRVPEQRFLSPGIGTAMAVATDLFEGFLLLL